MASIVAVHNFKGGVGKTTIAVNLAFCSAVLAHKRTLLWELDPQGAASFLLGQHRAAISAKRVFSRDAEPAELIEPTKWPGLSLLGADLSLRNLDRNLAAADKPKRLRKLLQGMAGEYDLIVLDCPPGLGEVSDQVFRAADLVVVPVPPTPLALRGLEQVSEHIARDHDGNPPLLPVFSMVDRRKKLHRETVEQHPDWSVVPQASEIERMAVEHAPLLARSRASTAALGLIEAWSQVDRALASISSQGGKGAKPPRLPRKRA